MNWLKLRASKPEAPLSVVPKSNGLARAVYKASQLEDKITYPLQLPTFMRGVVPVGETAGIAMDDNFTSFASSVNFGQTVGFPGYPRLSFLATIAEYRAMASALSTELTREWITINSSETAGDETKDKVTELTKKLQDIGLQQVIQRAAEHDAYFGRAQIFIDIKDHDIRTPLILSPKTIKLNSFDKVATVEAIWTTPSVYNSINPAADDFYKPRAWFMLGKIVHSSRLVTVITRPLPDLLKPAFDFSGMSLSQLAEPYVNNWLRTRQSVSDLINNFSITALKTAMMQTLDGSDDGTSLIQRAALFTAMRSNKGLMLLDKDAEDLVQQNVPLGSLDKLQAQAQEHMCAVSRLPAIILTGISPTGLNASSEGEIKAFYDWIAAQQEAYWRQPIETIFKVIQLSMYGSIDPDITWEFDPLYQMTPEQLSKIRLDNATAAGTYIDRGVIDASEERERLARDSDSGYQGLDLSLEIVPPMMNNGENDDEEDDTPSSNAA
jgi:phage-related protein (TIGR01555 family)